MDYRISINQTIGIYKMQLVCNHRVPHEKSYALDWFCLPVPTGEYIGYTVPESESHLEGDALMHLVHHAFSNDVVTSAPGHIAALARYRNTRISDDLWDISIVVLKIKDTLIFGGVLSTDNGLRAVERFFGYEGDREEFVNMRGWYLGAKAHLAGDKDSRFDTLLRDIPLENIKVLETKTGKGDSDWYMPLLATEQSVGELIVDINRFLTKTLPVYSDANLDKSELITKRGLILGECNPDLRSVMEELRKRDGLPIAQINAYHMSNRASKNFLAKCMLS